MDLDWYNKMIAAAQQRQTPQPQTAQQIAEAARANPPQRFAMPAFTDPNWKPMTTADVLGPDYAAPEGGPTADQLNAHPVWQSILSLMSGAPVASIANSNDMPTMLRNVLSGIQKLDMAPMPQQLDSAATYIAPTPGQAGWLNPTWAAGAMPGNVAPPKPSTNDIGHYLPTQTHGNFDPFAFGQATPGSWLDKSQQSFQQGGPSAPVVNPWSYQQQRGPGFTGADPKPINPNFGNAPPWGKPWYS